MVCPFMLYQKLMHPELVAGRVLLTNQAMSPGWRGAEVSMYT